MSDSSSSKRPLSGLVVGISISEPENLTECGYTPADINRATVRVSEALLAEGARLMFGHDWRPDGVMDAICRIAVKFQPTESAGSSSKPLIHNLLAWPNQSAMDPTLRLELEQRGVLLVDSLPAPKGEWQSPKDDIAKALALAEMRQELAEHCDARVCLGGREARNPTDKIGGFYAGVIEEAYYSALAHKPIYFASFFGGACRSLASYLKDQTHGAGAVLRVVPSKQQQCQTVISRATINVTENIAISITEDLSHAFVESELLKLSGLDPDDWNALLDAPDTEAFITWAIRGLREVAKQKATSTSTAQSSSPRTQGRAKRSSSRTKRK